MYWTLEFAGSLDDAPWPATEDELIDYANRSGAPEDVIENLKELETTEVETNNEVVESVETTVTTAVPESDEGVAETKKKSNAPIIVGIAALASAAAAFVLGKRKKEEKDE